MGQNIFEDETCTNFQYIGISHFIAFCFIVPCRHCGFYKTKVCGNSALSKHIDAIFFQQHLLILCLCHIYVIFELFQAFSLYYQICYGDLWSLVFDATIAKIMTC